VTGTTRLKLSGICRI